MITSQTAVPCFRKPQRIPHGRRVDVNEWPARQHGLRVLIGSTRDPQLLTNCNYSWHSGLVNTGIIDENLDSVLFVNNVVHTRLRQLHSNPETYCLISCSKDSGNPRLGTHSIVFSSFKCFNFNIFQLKFCTMFHISCNPSELYLIFANFIIVNLINEKNVFSCRQYLPWHWKHLIKRCIDVTDIDWFKTYESVLNQVAMSNPIPPYHGFGS